MIINTGAWAVDSHQCLIEGLKTKKVGYAGLDVYEEEELIFMKISPTRLLMMTL